MNITDVKVHKLDNSTTLALASITIGKDFVVTNLRVLNGKNGMWVAMPSRKTKDGEYKDIAFPITKDARDYIQAAVLQAYEQDSGYQDHVHEKVNRESDKLDEISEDSLPF